MAEASHLAWIRERMRHGQFHLWRHATKQMGLRGRILEDVNQRIMGGDLIWEYPEEMSYAEFLFLRYPPQPKKFLLCGSG
jgi:hypothetical protein